MKKFLLSTGRSTNRVEYYILDLFKLYLGVYPDDIPGARGIGFDFSLSGVMKSEIEGVISTKLSALIEKITSRFGDAVEIQVTSIEIIDEKQVNVVIDINSTSEEITIDINSYNN